MKETERRLLTRILESPHFAQAESLKRTLVYLCEKSDSGSPPKEYEIAVSALKRSAGFDPKTDPIVRVSIAGIRQRLQAYFKSQGRGETLRLEIPKGAYRVAFSEVPAGTGPVPPAIRGSETAGIFWGAYLSGHAKNILIYTDVLFFRDDAGNYLRNIYVNGLPGGADEIRRRAPGDAFRALKPSYHFTSAGEVQAMLALIRLFARLNAPLEIRNARFTSWNELHSSNLIFLGSSRTNCFIDALQTGNNFIITADGILNLAPLEGEKAIYAGRRHMEGKLERAAEPALVTRRPGLATGTVITTVSANHGRGVEGAAQFLSLEPVVDSMLDAYGLYRNGELPDHFQLLVEIQMVDFDDEVISVEYLTHRAIGDSATTTKPFLLRGPKMMA